MPKVLLIARDDEERRRLTQELRRLDFACTPVDDAAEALTEVADETPDLVLINQAAPVLSAGDTREVLHVCASQGKVPVLALVAEEQLSRHDLAQGFEDFILCPPRTSELLLRLKQALWRNGRLLEQDSDTISCGDLLIDVNRYEVYLAGHPVELTFKEYELLKFLALNQDKVFTREMLLNRVWGYDYYGGARTVDVHIRRLRSKIEDRGHVFIDTVRNVGYRFRPSLVGERY